LSDAELAERLAAASVIARAVPAHKLRIVRALQAQGDVVAMTGDGVNDAPALKAANIGIAMGSRGSDVARESASLVVLDDNFTSIVDAVRMGRRIYGNLRKAVSYIIAVHLPIAGIALLPIFFGSPVALMPVHIAFLELIIDPACSLAFEAEPEESDTMRRPPRDPNASLYSGRAVRFGFLEGASVMGFVLAVYVFAYLQSYPEAEIRTVTFTTLVLGNLALILASRSHVRSPLASLTDRNPIVWWIVAGTLAALFAVLSVPWLRELFRLAQPNWSLSVGALAVGAAILATLMVMRYLVYGRSAPA
jgi:Ca2+-transporting ATPase